MKPNSKAQATGNKYIEVAYQFLLKHDTATTGQLVEVTGSNNQMFGSSQCPRINEYMHATDKPHRFRVKPGIGGRGGYAPVWSLREYKVTV